MQIILIPSTFLLPYAEIKKRQSNTAHVFVMDAGGRQAEVDQRVGHYKIIKALGKGAMGAVYKGMDEQLQMPVAIKVLAPGIASDPENLARFEREARAAANLRHPNIAHVFFVGRTSDDSPFYAMEYIEGPSLKDVIVDHLVLSGEQILTVMKQTASALGFAADNRVLHRDVKPGNIMLAKEGGAKLVDFGMAKLTDSDHDLTATGMALGTPNYISPEQAHGETIDFRADMYSLGVSFFEFLSGNLPFTADTPVAVIMKHMSEPIPSLTALNDQYPRELVRIIERMMAKQPAARFPDYNALIAALDQVAIEHPDFPTQHWTFCESCRCNTRLEDGEHCSRCQTVIGPQVREELLMAVYLLGFDGPEARKRVKSYMLRVTRRPEPAIEQMLGRLPIALAHRLPQQDAKKLQTKLHEMGAQIELRRVGKREVQVSEGREMLKLSTSQTMRATSANLHAPTAVQNSKSGDKTKIIGIATACIVLLVITVLWFWPFGDDSSNTGAPVAAAETAAKKPVKKTNTPEAKAETEKKEEATPDAAANANADAAIAQDEKAESNKEQASQTITQAVSPAGNCHFRIIGELQADIMTALGRECDTMYRQLAAGSGTASLASKARLLVDASRPVADMTGRFGIGMADGKDVIYAAGYEGNDAVMKAAIVAQIANQNLRKTGGKILPGWLKHGFAPAVVRHYVPGIYEPDVDLKGNELFDDDELWSEALENGQNVAYAQAASFVSYLYRTYQCDSIMDLARKFRSGSDAETAFREIFQQDRQSVVTSWRAQLRR